MASQGQVCAGLLYNLHDGIFESSLSVRWRWLFQGWPKWWAKWSLPSFIPVPRLYTRGQVVGNFEWHSQCRGAALLAPTGCCCVRMWGQKCRCSDVSREARNPSIYVRAPNLHILATNSNKNKYIVQAKQNLPSDGCGLRMTVCKVCS